MARVNLAGNPNLKDALGYARELGLIIEPRRHGELKVTDPVTGDHAITSSQRRSTSRVLMKLLRTAEERYYTEESHEHPDPGLDGGPEGAPSS